MDLAGQALEVTPWRPEAYERARTVLRGAMAESGSLREATPLPAVASVPEVAPVRGRGSSLAGHRRRRTLGTRGKVGIGAGIGAIAAAAALILVATSTPQPAAPTSLPTTRTGSASQPSGASTSSTGSAGTQAPLVKLAAYLAADPKPTGDATLVESQSGINRWDLYADDGRYFFSLTEAGLSAQVKKDNSDQGTSDMLRLEIAAAIYAVKGNLATAALKMAMPFAHPIGTFSSVQLEDADAWENCVDALVAGSGNPQVRAGVLRLVSSLADVTVTHGNAGGQPTLTLTGESGYDGPKNGPKARGEGPDRYEALTINADTGIPLEFNVTLGSAHKPVGPPITYVVTRVSLAGIAVGKF